MEKILIIEDEPLLVETISDLLKIEGFDCITAKDGDEGISKAVYENPDLILCDVKMPGMNGYEVLKSIRKNPKLSQVPFIFLSAMVEKKDLRTGMDLGADDYLTKPFAPDELIAAIKTRLSKSREIKEKLSELRTSIAQSLPHELRTPLVSILGYAQILETKLKEHNDDEGVEFSNSIYEAGLKLNHLIQNFIVYTKLKILENEPASVRISSDDKSLLSEKMMSSITEKISKKYLRGNDLKIDINETEIPVPLNDLSIIIEEITDNAFKFSEPGSKIYIASSKSNGDVKLIISDEGRGFKDDQLEKLDAYIQFEREIYEQQGVGLGLIISKKLVEHYGGEFKLESSYKKGTTITISFP